MTENPDPTPLDQYHRFGTVEDWALPIGMDTRTGDVFPILGFRVDGQWGGLRLAPEQVSDMTITLGQWLVEYVAAHDDDEQQP